MDTAAFLVVGIGGNAGRHFVAAERAAHGDCPDRRETAADHGKQFKAGHVWHIEIGKKQFGYLIAYLVQSGEAIFGGAHAVTYFCKYSRQREPNSRLIVNYEECCIHIRHLLPPQKHHSRNWREYLIQQIAMLVNS